MWSNMPFAKSAGRDPGIFFIIGLALLVVGAVLAATPPNDATGRLIAYLAAYGLCAPMAGALSLWALRRGLYRQWSGLVSIFCILAALAFIALAAAADFSIMWKTNAAIFARGAAFGFILIVGILLEARASPKLWPIVIPVRIFAVGVIILAIVTTALVQSGVNGSLDWITTLGVSIGPALRVMNGGVPLVDAFSIYGLGYFLVFAAAFSTIVAPSFPSAAFVVSLANATYVMVAAVIMMRCVRSLVLTAAAIVLITVAIVPQWLGLPPAGGLRFLPPLLVALGLTFQPLERRISLLSLLPLLIAGFWSIEAFVWSFLTFSCGIGGRLLYERARLAEFVRCIGGAGLIVLAAHAVFSIATYILAGQWPRYDIYFDLVWGAYSGNAWATIPFSIETWAWAAEGVIYFVGLGVAIAKIFDGRSRDGSDCLIVRAILPVTVAGLLGMWYWVGRPFAFNLWPTVVPAAIIATVAVDRFFARFRHRRALTLLDSVSIFAVGSALILLSGVVGVRAGLRAGFSELLSGSVSLNEYAREKIEYLRSLEKTPMVPEAYDPISWDAFELVRKYQPNKRKVALFLKSGRDIPVYLLAKQNDAFGVSSSLDFESRIWSASLLARARHAVAPGTYVFIENSFADYYHGRRRPAPDENYGYSGIQFLFYPEVRDRYNLCILEESKNGVLATVAKLKTDGSCSRPYDP